jgi:beta-N-acetylhexosaminidase
MLLIPADLEASYRDLLAAVQSGEISQQRLDESVRKVLELKASVALHKGKLVDLDKLPVQIAKPENLAIGQQVADKAVTLVRDNGKLLPLHSAGTAAPSLPYQSVAEVRNHLVVVVFSDDLRNDSGRMLEHQILARVPDAHILYVDPRSAAGTSSEILSAVDTAEHVIAALYVVPTPGKAIRGATGPTSTVAMADASATLLKGILDRAAARTAVIALGNPYLAQDFPEVQNYLCTFSNATVSETAAVKALFGEIPIQGHLPVTIPGIASRGSGLQHPASGGSHVQH